uniref:Lymphocyte antigen 96 n=1 Tax=Pogona vitticeps TaxID=103695 RepID=A0ABM5GBX1_9SAUR
MFQLIVMILFVSGFTVAQEKQLLCRSDDLDIFYSSCSPGTSTFFFTVKPCSLKVSVWMGFMFWIPKFDITVLTSYTSLWYGGVNSLKWKSVICKGVDDGYSFCGALKGETINTTVRISGAQPTYDQGEYTFVFKAFSGYYKDLALCMNYTFIIKEKLYG